MKEQDENQRKVKMKDMMKIYPSLTKEIRTLLDGGNPVPGFSQTYKKLPTH